MEVRFIGGRAEGRVLELSDRATDHDFTHEDGTVERYVTHYTIEVGDPRRGGRMSKFAYFAPESMTQLQVLERANELFDEPDED